MCGDDCCASLAERDEREHPVVLLVLRDQQDARHGSAARETGKIGTGRRDVLSSQGKRKSAEEKAWGTPVLVGFIPQVVVLDPRRPGELDIDAGNCGVELTATCCRFIEIFQAPMGMRLLSRAARGGTKTGSYKYNWAERTDGGRGK